MTVLCAKPSADWVLCVVVVSVAWLALPAAAWLLISCSRWSRSFSRWSANTGRKGCQQQEAGVAGTVPATWGVLPAAAGLEPARGKDDVLSLAQPGVQQKTQCTLLLYHSWTAPLQHSTGSTCNTTARVPTPVGVTVPKHLACAGAAPAWRFGSVAAPQSPLSDPAAGRGGGQHHPSATSSGSPCLPQEPSS